MDSSIPDDAVGCDMFDPKHIENYEKMNMNEKAKSSEEPKAKEPNHILRLKMLSQLSRKLAYWIDADTEIPAWVHEHIKTSLASMQQVSQFLMDQTVDVSDVSENKLIPTHPEMWHKAKIEARKRFNEAEDKANIYASKWYKEHGGQWRKKSGKNG
jgi:hypothetical protein